MKLSENWVLWFIVGLIGIIGFAIATGSCEDQAPPPVTPTSTPTANVGKTDYLSRPTPTPFNKDVRQARLAVQPSVPVSRVQRAAGIGLSLADFEDLFSGLKFESAPLNNGKDRWMATSEVHIVEVIGPARSLEQASIFVGLEDVTAALIVIGVFLDLVAPNWSDGIEWVGEHAMEAADRAITTRHGSLQFKMKIQMMDEWELLSLEVSGK